MATLYKTDGTVEKVVPANGKSFTALELQRIVGGWIELARTHDGKPMMIDEEGKLKCKPVNQTATALFAFNHIDVIVGDAVVGTPEEMGENEEDEEECET